MLENSPVSAIEIPTRAITPDALNGLIEEFVTRDGTDYGAEETSVGDKKTAIMAELGRGTAVIVFDTDTESCNIVLKTEMTGAVR